MLPASTRRVPLQTAPAVNDNIHKQMEQRIYYFAHHLDEIPARLEELDREWDIERTLEANAASVAFTGTILGLAVSKKFFLIPLAVSGFLLQHALQGWCPPLPVFRRMGVRTRHEIDAERYALKALRGDFTGAKSPTTALHAVED